MSICITFKETDTCIEGLAIDVKDLLNTETMGSKLEQFSQGFTDTCFPLILLVSVVSITLVITVFE